VQELDADVVTMVKVSPHGLLAAMALPVLPEAGKRYLSLFRHPW